MVDNILLCHCHPCCGPLQAESGRGVYKRGNLQNLNKFFKRRYSVQRLSKLLTPTSDWNSSSDENQDKVFCQQLEDIELKEDRVTCTVLIDNEGTMMFTKQYIF